MTEQVQKVMSQLPLMRNYLISLGIGAFVVLVGVAVDMLLLVSTDGKVELGDAAWLAIGGLAAVCYEHSGRILKHYIGGESE